MNTYLYFLKSAIIFAPEIDMALANDATPVSLRAAIRHEEILYALEVKGRVSTSDLETRLGNGDGEPVRGAHSDVVRQPKHD